MECFQLQLAENPTQYAVDNSNVTGEVQGWVILGQQGPDFFMSLSSASGVLAPRPSEPWNGCSVPSVLPIPIHRERSPSLHLWAGSPPSPSGWAVSGPARPWANQGLHWQVFLIQTLAGSRGLGVTMVGLNNELPAVFPGYLAPWGSGY